jgi:alcohol dehydrogenase
VSDRFFTHVRGSDALWLTETSPDPVLSLGTRGRHLQTGPTRRRRRRDAPTNAMVMQETELLGSCGMSVSRDDETFRMVATGMSI